MSGRTFTAALKPAWSEADIKDFVGSLTGTAKVYAITHDKDKDTEAHTHFLIDYKTPRKITTVANLFNVEANFIEIVRNKKGMLRYLTHLDKPSKHQYKAEEVITNDTVAYKDLIIAQGLSDKEIAEYIAQGKGMELLGLVPVGKLRTIQGFMHFDKSNATLKEIRALNGKIDSVVKGMEFIEDMAKTYAESVELSKQELKNGMQAIAEAITKSVIALKNPKRR